MEYNIFEMENNTHTPNQIKVPKVVGSYEITGSKVQFHFTKKPSLINRMFCKWCLGWTWRDKCKQNNTLDFLSKQAQDLNLGYDD